MSELPTKEIEDDDETSVSRTYARIERNTLVIDVLAVLAGTFWGWRYALGVMIGAIAAYLNMRWLLYGTQLMVGRMLETGKSSKAALLLAFLGRLGAMLAVAYVIFVSSRPAFYGFLVALFLPIAGAVCEAVYEALPLKSTARHLG